MDWIFVTLGKIQVFDRLDSQFSFLKDTALAYTRSYLESPTIYSLPTLDQKRTLVHFLMTLDPPLEVQEYIEAYSNLDPIALDYQVIKLTQKERELKIDGRFFGQSPYAERARRFILEDNISAIMTKYNSSQAMTLSELDKMKKMYVLCRGPSKSKSVKYHIVKYSMDVEAFNNRFRKPFVSPSEESSLTNYITSHILTSLWISLKILSF